MTLPALIGKANDFILKQQFKKAMNTLNNFHSYIFAQEGRDFDCGYGAGTNECTEYWNIFEKVAKPVTICKNKAYEKGCIPKYKGNDTIYLESNPDKTPEEALEAVTGCSGWSQNNILNNNKAYVLRDGQIIMFYRGMKIIFAVDINGYKKPNKWGHDLFMFTLSKTGNIVKFAPMSSGGCTIIEKGGKSAERMLQDVYKK